MIHGFPIPYPDETFYSVVARRMSRFEYASQKRMLADIFGTPDVIATIEFPAPLSWLIAELNPKHPCANADALLANQTLLPWFQPFLPAERAAKIRECMLHSNSKGAWATAGIIAGRVKTPEFLRYCPQCLRENVDAGRDLYWRRLHQLTGIEACPQHGMMLENSLVQRLNRQSRQAFQRPPPELAECARRHCEQPVLVRIAKLGEELLAGNFPSFGEDIQRRYFRLIKKQGLLKGTHLVKIRELEARVRAMFPADYLERTGCQIKGTDYWLTKIVRKPGSMQAPIKHLVLLCALDATIADLAATGDEENAVPPKLCQNHLCPQQGQALTFVSKKYSGDLKAETSLWQCQTCGQVTHASKAGEKHSWIKDYGHIWKTKLTSLWQDRNVSVNSIARTLNVDPLTVKRQAWRIKLPFPRVATRTAKATDETKTEPIRVGPSFDVEAAQKEWLTIVAAKAGAGINALRNEHSALFTRLYKVDRRWLRQNTPRKARPTQRVALVNWGERDNKLANLVAEQARILRQATPPKLVSKPALARAAKCEAWTQHKVGLIPKTVETIAKLAETRVDFACRRVAYAVEQLNTAGEKLKPWRIVQKACLRPDLRQEPRIIEAITAAKQPDKKTD